MPRKPIGEVAMTPAERQRRRRVRLLPRFNPGSEALRIVQGLRDRYTSEGDPHPIGRANEDALALVAALLIETDQKVVRKRRVDVAEADSKKRWPMTLSAVLDDVA